MAIRFIRKPSDTPNISNRDDFIFLRYAYGNQNGYIKNFGTELGYEINGNIFKITSGRVNLQGIVSEVDSAGVDIVIDNVAGTRFFTVYYEVNLALQTTSIKSLYDNAIYPSVSAGDDLTQNSAGIARLELYRFKVVDNIISNVVKVVKAIEYAENVKVKNADNADMLGGKLEKDLKVSNADNAEFAFKEKYSTSTGTISYKFRDIYTRINNLGFSEGSVSTSYTALINNVKKMAKYAILNLSITGSNIATSFATIPTIYRPKTTVYSYGILTYVVVGLPNATGWCRISVNTNGAISIDNKEFKATNIQSIMISNFGYEIN